MKTQTTPKNLEQWLAHNGVVRHVGGTMGNLVKVHGKRDDRKLTLLIDWKWRGEVQVPVYATFPDNECDLMGGTSRI